MTAMLFTSFLSQDLKRRIVLLLQERADFVAQIFGHVVDGFEPLLDEGCVNFSHSYLPPIPSSRLDPVSLFTKVLKIRIVTIRIRLMALENAYSPISSK